MAKRSGRLTLANACLAAWTIVVIREASAKLVTQPSIRENTTISKKVPVHAQGTNQSSNTEITKLRTTLIKYRNLICGKCSSLWKKYSKRCAAWLDPKHEECSGVNPAILSADAKLLSNSLKCLRSHLSAKAAQCIRAMDERVPDFIWGKKSRTASKGRAFSMDQDYTRENVKDMSGDGMDAPIGWRTIQGKWFQKLRRSAKIGRAKRALEV